MATNTKKVTPATINIADKAVEKKASEKKAPEKKTSVRKPAAAKKTAEKETVEKKATVRKATAKKPAAKKTAVDKKEIEVSTFIQYNGRQAEEKEIIARVKDAWISSGRKEDEIKKMVLYIKPEENAVYYVINETETGSVGF